MKAYGVTAVAVSGPNSREYWKPFFHPTKFEGMLPVLWRAEDVTIYGILQPRAGLAHVVSESALVARTPARANDTAGVERYVDALDDSSMPSAELRWNSKNEIRIRTNASAAQVLSVQVSYHPGWHASVEGHKREIKSDGLGLMWLRPGCSGTCEVELTYDGGWEQRILRWLSLVSIVGFFAFLPVARLVRRRQ
jgi:hypothetical protein